ncbi:hypothetical protein LWC34_21860 [Kibdelosporangium philippinense]|uniref:Uncharacterized protein n=1 Tax=Kibdelosporangium philippinense TaxID=211113 RepID=A0ABS8ZC54_9PSEU|nr:hypothetical protein [Kibdelosporangium philippinense]MCE7005453.1 hypothetical protein [Kibdelosporangium philippinense]
MGDFERDRQAAGNTCRVKAAISSRPNKRLPPPVVQIASALNKPMNSSGISFC